MTEVGLVVAGPVAASTLAWVIDVLAAANRIAQRPCFNWTVRTFDGRPVDWRGGAQWPTDGALDATFACDWLIVIDDGAGGDACDFATVEVECEPQVEVKRFVAALREVAGKATLASAIGRGVVWLAATGRLDGHRASVPRPLVAHLASRHPAIHGEATLFHIDRDCATGVGGAATLDFMLTCIGRSHGAALAAQIADALHAPAPRDGGQPQRHPGAHAAGGRDARLAEALQLMDANLEEPLTTDELAALVGVSRRQLERLFRQHLDAVPSRYYLGLRLAKAQAALRRTSRSVVQISLACGFASAAHFSHAYRMHFGVTPREDRRRAHVPSGGATTVADSTERD